MLVQQVAAGHEYLCPEVRQRATARMRLPAGAGALKLTFIDRVVATRRWAACSVQVPHRPIATSSKVALTPPCRLLALLARQQQFDHHPLGAVLGRAAAEILKEAGYGGFDLLA